LPCGAAEVVAVAFQIVELTLDTDNNVIERRVVPYPYQTREEAVTAIECIVSTLLRRVTSRRRTSGGQLLTMVTARGSSSKVSDSLLADLAAIDIPSVPVSRTSYKGPAGATAPISVSGMVSIQIFSPPTMTTVVRAP
jgi:hypothetical protein